MFDYYKKNKKKFVKVELPPKLIPIFMGEARYRGAYGGRGSGKTKAFAKMAAIKGLQLAHEQKKGIIVAAREFMNTLNDSSMAEIKAAINAEDWLKSNYDIGENYIRTKDKNIEFVFIGLRYNLDSIKSKAQIHLFWVDEAENVTENAWRKILPTVREKNSEIWLTWNPESATSATHKRFREAPPKNAKITELNWRDNPWFPEVLNNERLNDFNNRPQYYAHIWEGDFITVVDGAYFAQNIIKLKEEGRVAHIVQDPLLTLQAFWDIGGSGAKADHTAIWIAQFVGKEIRILDYYEAQGQPLETHIDWLKINKYQNALMVLPHDGATKDRVYDVSFQSVLEQAGFEVKVIPNQGAGAARMRIEAARRLFSRMWFNEETTKAGLAALAWYHEKRDDVRGIGLGPDHDWSSHAADAFGLMCVKYEEPRINYKRNYDFSQFEEEDSWLTY
ncbi:PBSX family phage terminase large subunit [Bartonella sp. DGB1]|uniref:PBSX family phage terminase large subunit n=1 Tax=Bartonella sp. DGB1 TaxID=3239807 RepID=UPI003526335C